MQGAFTHAFDVVFGLKALSIDTITHHGCTDALVSARTLVAAGVSQEDADARWPDVQAAMVEYATAHASTAGDGLELLPGIVPLLTALQARGAMTGLVTGNLVEIAFLKMSALGIETLFSTPKFGGFGSDHSDRGHLVRIAGERARALSPGIRSAWHIGDTVRASATRWGHIGLRRSSETD